MFVEDILGMLEQMYLYIKSLRVQRMEFFKGSQCPNKTFEQLWSGQTMLKEQRQLREGQNSEGLDVLELLRGV